MSCDLPAFSLDPIAAPSSISFPGGANITFFNNFEAGTTPLADIQPALAPLAPLMNTVSSVTSIFDLLQTLITDPPSAPAKIAEVSEKVEKVASAAPQLSLPATIIGLIDSIVSMLQQVIRQLEHLITESVRAEAVAAKAEALGDECLSQVADRSKQAIRTQGDNINTSLGAANGVILTLNLLMSIIGLGPVSDLSGLVGLSLSLIIEPLNAIIGVLLAVRSVIPVP